MQRLDLPRLTRDHQTVSDAAAFLQQSRRGEVGIIHQHTRRKAVETDCPVDVAHDTRRHRETLRADADLVADAHIQPAQQPPVHPHRAAQGHGTTPLARLQGFVGWVSGFIA